MNKEDRQVIFIYGDKECEIFDESDIEYWLGRRTYKDIAHAYYISEEFDFKAVLDKLEQEQHERDKKNEEEREKKEYERLKRKFDETRRP